MGQSERAVAGLREGEEEQGGEVPVPGGAAGAEGGVAREAASSEQEDRPAGWESDDEEDTEGALTEEESEGVVAPVGNAGQGDASGSAQDEDHEAPAPAPEENHAATAHFELRGFRPARRAIAHATPPSSYRLPLRGRKRWNPSRLPIDAAGDAASGCGNAHHDPATSEAASGPAASAASPGSPSATSRHAGAPAMANAAGHGDNNEALGSTAKHAAAPAAASCRLPSRSRKRRRPEHYPDTEEAVAAARARARRSDAALDTLLTSLACASPPVQRPAWVTGTASGGGPEETDESARVLAISAILGAALALSVVSCVLFYIVGQQTASGSGPSGSHKK